MPDAGTPSMVMAMDEEASMAREHDSGARNQNRFWRPSQSPQHALTNTKKIVISELKFC